MMKWIWMIFCISFITFIVLNKTHLTHLGFLLCCSSWQWTHRCCSATRSWPWVQRNTCLLLWTCTRISSTSSSIFLLSLEEQGGVEQVENPIALVTENCCLFISRHGYNFIHLVVCILTVTAVFFSRCKCNHFYEKISRYSLLQFVGLFKFSGVFDQLFYFLLWLRRYILCFIKPCNCKLIFWDCFQLHRTLFVMEIKRFTWRFFLVRHLLP